MAHCETSDCAIKLRALDVTYSQGVRGRILLDDDSINRRLISPIHLGVITVEIKCTRSTSGFIAIVLWRLNGWNQATPSLPARRGKIWMLHLRSDRHDLTTSIRQTPFNLNRWSDQIDASNDYAQFRLEIEMFFAMESYSWVFEQIQLSRHNNLRIFWFPHLLD